MTRSIRSALSGAAVWVSAVWLAACGGAGSQAAVGGVVGDVAKDEAYCELPGFPASLRHTYILLDQRALARSTAADEFVKANALIRDVLLAFGDPERTVRAGFADSRERISLFLIPSGGAEVRLLFSGCVPSFSQTELVAADASDPAWKRFFVGGFRQKLEDDQTKFRGYFLGAVLRAAADAPPKALAETGSLVDSDIIRSLRTSGRLINSDSGVPRLVLLSNLADIKFGTGGSLSDARAAGFADGAKSGLDLGRSELHVFLVEGSRVDITREYVSAFALSQNAHLVSWAQRPSVMPLAPRSVRRYAGTVDYVSLNAPIQVRLGVDRDGALVDSWLILQGDPDQAVPLTGRFLCETEEHCRASSDKGGFAQAWSTKTGLIPQFDKTLPFAGVRNWELELEKDHLTGMIFDPVMKFPEPHTELQLTATVTSGARF